MTEFDRATGLRTFEYASSIAATWVWAPAIFVSSAIACQYGWHGLMWFLIPNALTLIVFGYAAAKAKHRGSRAGDAVENVSLRQKRLHDAISLLLLSCSTFVQLLGVYYLLSAWFDCPRWLSGAAVLLVAMAMVWKGGLKAVIRTDTIKYAVMLACAATLIYLSPPGHSKPEYSSADLIFGFGIPTVIGLMAAPYVDTTFWQRAKSIEVNQITKTFVISALLFALIPLAFGLVGMGKPSGWTIQDARSVSFQVALAVAVFCALISTIDSNLCAVGTLLGSRFTIVAFSLLMLVFFCAFDRVTIVDMFLIYGTARTAAAVPTVLSIFGYCDKTRLFWSTAAAATIGPAGFALCKATGYGDWAVAFTVLAAVLPLAGYKPKQRKA